MLGRGPSNHPRCEIELLCRLVEFLKVHRTIWLLVLAIACVGIFFTVYYGLFISGNIFYSTSTPSDPLGRHSSYTWLSTRTPINATTIGWLESIFFACLGLGFTFCFVVCRQRKAVIAALAAGYWRSHLEGALKWFTEQDAAPRIIILKPTFKVLEDVGYFENEIVRSLRQGRPELDIEPQTVGEPPRTAWTLKDRNGTNVAVIIDFARNLTALKDLVESEAFGPVGKVFWPPRSKYEFLRDEYFRFFHKEHLKDTYEDRVTIVDGGDLGAAASAIAKDARQSEIQAAI